MFRIFLSYVTPRLEGETDSNSCMFHSMQEINLPTAEEERSCVFPTDEDGRQRDGAENELPRR